MLKKILLTVVIIIALLFIYAGFQSPDYVIQRQIIINAPAEKIFPYLNNMKLAEQWGPWKAEDPSAAMVISGPDEGVGSKTSWSGGKQLGTGSATIVESIANSKVGIHLEYTEPMHMTQESEYLLQNSGNQSVMTWKVTGQNNILSRVMCIFMNMDKMVGSMFEKGLANLKAIVEKA